MAARRRVALLAYLVVAVLAGGVVAGQLPMIGAGALLHPTRRPVTARPPEGCRNTTFAGVNVQLRGWRCEQSGRRRGTVVYLHGVADNRASGVGIIHRFRNQGFEVLAYDSRAHGESGGDFCTYGFLEKQDLGRVLNTLGRGSIVLFGASLGAAVALQHAADDAKVTAVIAAEVFSDLQTIARERAPFFIPSSAVRRAFEAAEQKGGFRVDDVSPVTAAASVTVPVLLIHGEADTDTAPQHSQRVFAALGGPKRLILVPGAKHNESLRGNVWDEIQRWVDDLLSRPPA
jgi:uncharacterized protein